MPIGVIINALSVVIGGILGALMGHKLSPKFKADITLVFGVCSMGMGISTIGLMENTLVIEGGEGVDVDDAPHCVTSVEGSLRSP